MNPEIQEIILQNMPIRPDMGDRRRISEYCMAYDGALQGSECSVCDPGHRISGVHVDNFRNGNTSDGRFYVLNEDLLVVATLERVSRETEEEVMEARSSKVLELAKNLDAKYIEEEVEERVNDALDSDAVVMFAKASAREAEEEFDMSREVMHLIASKATLEEISKIRDLADSLFIALHEFYKETAALVELAGENDREVLFNRNIIDDTWSYILPAEFRWEDEFEC